MRCICIEMRKTLGCANVFLQFGQDLTSCDTLRIRVHENELHVQAESKNVIIPLKHFFNIKARSLTNVIAEGANISFRLMIDKIQDNETPFKCEELWAGVNEPPQLHEGEDVSVHCANCEADLTGPQRFQRIREYPSGGFDINEFFCHHGPDYGEILVPSKSDLFYGFKFMILKKEIIQPKIKEKEIHIYCDRCLNYLGEIFCKNKAAKLWADAIQLKQNSKFHCVFKTSLSHSAELLEKLVRESTIMSEPYISQLQLCKILLLTIFPNRQQGYLLLHVLERQLQVLRNAELVMACANNNNNNNNNNGLLVELKRYKCFKLFYRVMGDTGIQKVTEIHKRDGPPPLVVYWQQDFAVHSFQISPTLFTSMQRELIENSMVLPEKYRNSHDNFRMSYIFYN